MKRAQLLIALLMAVCPLPALAQRGDGGGARSIAPSMPRGGARLGVVLSGGADAAPQVDGVAADSPAQLTGLRAGDRILAVDGEPMPSAQALIDAVRARDPGVEVRLRVGRTLNLVLDGEKRTSDGRFALGAYLNQDPDSVTVARLAPDHPAAAAGLRPADRIVSVDGARVQRESDLVEHMRSIRAPRAVALVIERELSVRLGAAPSIVEQPRGAPLRPLPPPDDVERALLDQVRALREEIEALREDVERLRRELARSRTR